MLGPYKAAMRYSIERPDSAERRERYRALLLEYGAETGYDGDFERFEEDLAGVSGRHEEPSGAVLLLYAGFLSGLSRVERTAAGFIAFSREDAETVRLERIYMRPGFRGQGFGSALLGEMMDFAARGGYAGVSADLPGEGNAAFLLLRGRGFMVLSEEPGRVCLYKQLMT